MMTLQRVAKRMGFACLLHEKPFAGVNGSGKHVNWSMSTDTGLNLLEPGDTPHKNLLFLFFCTAVVQAVEIHQDLLRAAIATAANDHRLGANEAPPAIISIFLGEQLSDVFEQITASGEATESKSSGFLGLGSPVLPKLPRHAGDRNRTSPFAFTGNKFEFRAVGSSQSVSFPLTVLNTIAAQAIEDLTAKVEAKLGKKRSKKAVQEAVKEVIADSIRTHTHIVFNGDGYSDEWHREAVEDRGLLNLKTTPDALDTLTNAKNVEVFSAYDVLDRGRAREPQGDPGRAVRPDAQRRGRDHGVDGEDAGAACGHPHPCRPRCRCGGRWKTSASICRARRRWRRSWPTKSTPSARRSRCCRRLDPPHTRRRTRRAP